MTAAQSVSPENVQLHVQGDIHGHVAIGNYIVQIGSIHGGVVNIAMPEEKSQIQLRPVPVLLRPAPFQGLLDRQNEVKTILATLQQTQPVEVYGQAGIGKSVLLRYLAYQSAPTRFHDGLIYRSARQQPLADLLQMLFEDFYESTPPAKLTDSQLRYHLQSRQALIILDDVG